MDEVVTNKVKEYFLIIEKAFFEATKSTNGVQSYNLTLAKKKIVLKTAGSFLGSFLLKALLHLPKSIESAETDLEIMIWDEKETLIKLPALPPEILTYPNGKSFPRNSFGEFYIRHTENKTVFHIYNVKTRKAIVCINDVQKLPNYFLAAPFFEILKPWSQSQGLNILHAGCVANDKHAVLIIGKGGMGKSTTSIQSLIGGLNYIGDDYVLVKLGENPTAYSLFCSGKLHTEHLKRFPDLDQIAYCANQVIYDKPLVFLNTLYKDRIILERPIKAIVAPCLSDSKDTTYESITAFEALKSLAPSTMFQLNLAGGNDLKKMAHLTKTTPCYKLNLGTDLEAITPAIIKLLKPL